MTQDEIIEMAKKAGIPTGSRFVGGEVVECLTLEVQSFAKLVAAKERKEMAEHCVEITRMAVDKAVASAIEKEREACATIAIDGCLVPPDGGSPTEDERLLCEHIAHSIRARGEA